MPSIPSRSPVPPASAAGTDKREKQARSSNGEGSSALATMPQQQTCRLLGMGLAGLSVTCSAHQALAAKYEYAGQSSSWLHPAWPSCLIWLWQWEILEAESGEYAQLHACTPARVAIPGLSESAMVAPSVVLDVHSRSLCCSGPKIPGHADTAEPS